MKAIISSLLLSAALTGCSPENKYPMPDCNAEKIDVEALFNTKNRKDDEVFIKVNKYEGQFPSYSYWEENFVNDDVIQYLGSEKIIYRWNLNRNDTLIELSDYYANGNLKKRYWRYTGKIKSFKEDSLPHYQYNNEIKVGKEYNFKEDCTLASIVDYDSIFKFTIQDVEKIMKAYDTSGKVISQEKKHKTDIYFWKILFKERKTNDWYEMILDPQNGKIIENEKTEVYEVYPERDEVMYD